MTESTPEQPENRVSKHALISAEKIGHDLLQALVEELKSSKIAWADLPEESQNESIDRLRQVVHDLVGQVLALVLMRSYPVCVATVSGVRFKKGIHVTLSVDKHAQSRHELADAEGKSVLVLMADPDALRDDLAAVRAEAEQGDLFKGSRIAIGDKYTGGDPRPFRRDEKGIAGEEPADTRTTLDPETEHVAEQSEDASWLCRCGKTIADVIHVAPDAPADLEVERDPLWKQATAALAGIGITIDEATAQGWTDEQCTEAQYFVTLSKDAKGKPPKVPKFISKATIDPNKPKGTEEQK